MKTALITAVSFGRIETVKLLLNGGANVNAQDQKGTTALHSAAYRGNKDIVEILLNNGADPSISDFNGHTPLSEARRSLGNLQMKELSRLVTETPILEEIIYMLKNFKK